MFRTPGMKRGGEPVRKAGVNQRSRMPSATAAMPSLSTVAMRWFQEASVADLVRGVAEDERPQPLRLHCGEVLGDEPADREPAEDDLADDQVVEQAGKVGRVVGDRVRRGPEVGQAVAALVVAQEREGVAEIAGHRVPDAEVRAQRVDEDERRPAAAARLVRMMERGSVDGSEMQRSISPGGAPRRLLDFGAR